ncbi:ABC transporter permease [Halarchaeum grantii]|uniref:ABC transporter permease n=1 Tax=Halarchaeum grantii TaxID=1193105 RepID=A0A830F3J1_9EURY|nr:magnesium transporter [Halarchaeum grantii]GGL35508.1 ABC transporter permease [Halarchaeum grantii]
MPEEWTVSAIVRATLPVLLGLTAVEIGSGLVLESFEATLYRHPSLLVLVPVTIGTAGNLGSILASRLSTSFHLGTLTFAATDDDLAGNALATVTLALTVFPLVGAGAWGATALTAAQTDLGVWTVVAVSFASGAVLALLAVVVTVVATYLAYRLRLDPDDVVIPVVTNVCDVLGIVVLFAVVQLLVG